MAALAELPIILGIEGGIRRDFAMVIVCLSVSGGAVLHYTTNILQYLQLSGDKCGL